MGRTLIGNIKGPQGERGLQGEQGERGLQGLKGDQGERGLQGLPGEMTATSVAPVFSPATAYSKGDYVTYGGQLYRFTADHAAGDWIGTDASAVAMTDDLNDLKSAFDPMSNIGTLLLNDKLTIEKLINTSGVAVTSSDAYSTDFIPIYKGWTVVFKHCFTKTGVLAFSFYTSRDESTYVPSSGIEGNGASTEVAGEFTAPYDGFIRLCTRRASIPYNYIVMYTQIANISRITDGLLRQNLKSYEYSQFSLGRYTTQGKFATALNSVVSDIHIATEPEIYVLDAYSSYIVIVGLFDYNEGAYSNYRSIAITAKNFVKVNPGEAIFVYIATSDNSDIDVSDIDYRYYRLSSFGSFLYNSQPKKIACVGDSLTAGANGNILPNNDPEILDENYPYYLSKILGCTVLNYGVPGYDCVNYWNNIINSSTPTDNFAFDSSIDTVLIMLGTNQGIKDNLETDVFPFSDYNDYVMNHESRQDNECGAYGKIIRKIIELTSNKAQVFLLTPPYGTYTGHPHQLERIQAARETIKKAGVFFNLPVIDVYAECGMGAYNGTVFRPVDDLHFNSDGYERLGTFVASKVKATYSHWE